MFLVSQFLISKLNSKTVPVLPSLGPSLIFSFHLFPSPVYPTGFFFCFFPGFLAIFILISSNNNFWEYYWIILNSRIFQEIIIYFYYLLDLLFNLFFYNIYSCDCKFRKIFLVFLPGTVHFLLVVLVVTFQRLKIPKKYLI